MTSRGSPAHAGVGAPGRQAGDERGLRPGGAAVPALRRRRDPRGRAWRRQPNHILVPGADARNEGGRSTRAPTRSRRATRSTASTQPSRLGVDMIEFDMLPEKRPGRARARPGPRLPRRRRTHALTLEEGLAHFARSLRRPRARRRPQAARLRGPRRRRPARARPARALAISSQDMRSLVAIGRSAEVGSAGRPEGPEGLHEVEAHNAAGASALEAGAAGCPARGAASRAGRVDAIMSHWRLVTPRSCARSTRRRRALRVDVDDPARRSGDWRDGGDGIISNDPRLFGASSRRCRSPTRSSAGSERATSVAGPVLAARPLRMTCAPCAPREVDDAAQIRAPPVGELEVRRTGAPCGPGRPADSPSRRRRTCASAGSRSRYWTRKRISTRLRALPPCIEARSRSRPGAPRCRRRSRSPTGSASPRRARRAAGDEQEQTRMGGQARPSKNDNTHTL